MIKNKDASWIQAMIMLDTSMKDPNLKLSSEVPADPINFSLTKKSLRKSDKSIVSYMCNVHYLIFYDTYKYKKINTFTYDVCVYIHHRN